MSPFETIKLPAIAIAAMYESSLVLVPEAFDNAPAVQKNKTASTQDEVLPYPLKDAANTATNALQEPEMLAVLGSFKKQVLIIVQAPDAVHCTEQSLEFITKIIGAVGLSLADVGLLNSHGKNFTYSDVKDQWPSRVALYFGLDPAHFGVPIRFPQFQVQQWDGCTFLWAPALSEMDGNSEAQVSLKTQLWKALKKIFT